MSPQPKYIRYQYVGADKLKDKVALITGVTGASDGPWPCTSAAKQPT